LATDKTLNKRTQQNYTVQLTVAASTRYRWGSLAYSLGQNLHAAAEKMYENGTLYFYSPNMFMFLLFLKQQNKNKTRFQKNSQISKK